ncbi:MAG: S9 family peptidase [Acidobacteria bacterium]|nr:S9 family peptidase [Acidobacteriota bacterium]MBV9478068.1 S9 family peptidase [Acidobacteriota bacterium]
MRRVRLLPLALLLLFSAAAFAAGVPLTHETMWLMKRIGAPALSPDGKWVVFSLTEPAYDEKDQLSDLWLVPADGSAQPRRLTNTKAGESDVTWSSDSRRIAFAAKRDTDDAAQIYVLDLAGGGEALRVTNVSTGASRPHFRPDGNAISFVSTVYPGALDDDANKKAAKAEKDRKDKVRVYDSFPVRAWDRWLDEKQAHVFVQSLTPGAPAKDVLAGTKLVASAGFGGTGGGEGRESLDAAWSPDGQWLVFAATSTRNTGAYAEVSFDLYRVSANGGEPEKLTTANGGYGSPDFSPDGKTLFATFNPNNGKVYNLNRLVAFDWPSMKNERVVAKTDRSVDDFGVTSDGRTIYFTAEDAGLVKIYSVPAAGGDAQLAVDPQRGVYTSLRVAERAPVVVAQWGSSVNPIEIVRVDLNAKKHTNLTSFNVEQAKTIDWQPPQHFWFTSKRGRRIHNMIVLPANFDASKKYPLFVLIHGGAANMWRDAISLRWNYHLLAKPGYVMLMTNYSGSTGFGEQFGQLIQGDPLRGPADELMEAADEAIKRYPFIDATRQVAGGASYGGHLTYALEAWSGDRFKALVAHAGLINLETQWATSDTIYGRELMNNGPVWEQGEVWRTQSPARFAAQFKTPILLSVGEHDFRVPLNNTLEAWSLLQRLRVPSRLLVWPEENHWILNAENSRVFYREVDEWLRRWVTPGPM